MRCPSCHLIISPKSAWKNSSDTSIATIFALMLNFVLPLIDAWRRKMVQIRLKILNFWANAAENAFVPLLPTDWLVAGLWSGLGAPHRGDLHVKREERTGETGDP
jgi:hypothetical protein